MRKFSLYFLLLSIGGLALMLSSASTVEAQYSSPVRVLRNEENPARHPFQGRCTPAGFPNTITCGISVPIGQTLVIEYVSLALYVAPGAKVRFIRLGTQVNGVEIEHHLQSPTLLEALNDPFVQIDLYQLGQEVRLYADAGSTVNFRFYVDGPSYSYADFTLSGYTVPVP